MPIPCSATAAVLYLHASQKFKSLRQIAHTILRENLMLMQSRFCGAHPVVSQFPSFALSAPSLYEPSDRLFHPVRPFYHIPRNLLEQPQICPLIFQPHFPIPSVPELSFHSCLFIPYPPYPNPLKFIFSANSSLLKFILISINIHRCTRCDNYQV